MHLLGQEIKPILNQGDSFPPPPDNAPTDVGTSEEEKSIHNQDSHQIKSEAWEDQKSLRVRCNLN